MAKSIEREKAIALRKQGKSVKEIAKELGVARSSASIWTRDIILSDEQREFLRTRRIAAGQAGRMLGAEMNKRKRLERVAIAREEAARKIRYLSKEQLYYTGLGLYWGEGAKASNGMVAVINSDPLVIQLMLRWFKECWGVTPDRFRPRIYISAVHRDREEKIIRFWSDTLCIPTSQFSNMVFLGDRKKIYENRDVYYGVLTLRVSKGADLRNRILADIEQVAKKGSKPA